LVDTQTHTTQLTVSLVLNLCLVSLKCSLQGGFNLASMVASPFFGYWVDKVAAFFPNACLLSFTHRLTACASPAADEGDRHLLYVRGCDRQVWIVSSPFVVSNFVCVKATRSTHWLRTFTLCCWADLLAVLGCDSFGTDTTNTQYDTQYKTSQRPSQTIHRATFTTSA
jgi:hypothetical protein